MAEHVTQQLLMLKVGAASTLAEGQCARQILGNQVEPTRDLVPPI